MFCPTNSKTKWLIMVFKFVIQWRLMFSWAMLINTMKLLSTLPSKKDCLSQNMPYCNVIFLKRIVLKDFGPLIKHRPHWINFTILTFISENNRYSRYLYKI
jgi:hypothetical protein